MVTESFFQTWEIGAVIVKGHPQCDWPDTIEGLKRFLKEHQEKPAEVEVIFRRKGKPSRARLKKTKAGYKLKSKAAGVNIRNKDASMAVSAKVDPNHIIIPGFFDWLEKGAQTEE